MAVVRAGVQCRLCSSAAAVLLLSSTELFERCFWAGPGGRLDPLPSWAAAGPGHCSMEAFHRIHLHMVSAALTILVKLGLGLVWIFFFPKKNMHRRGWECSPWSLCNCPQLTNLD